MRAESARFFQQDVPVVEAAKRIDLGPYAGWTEPERIVFTSAALDADGNPMFEVLTTVTFAEQNGKTKQTMRARVIKTTTHAAPYLKGMEAGWTQSLERLAESLAKA